MSDKYFKTELIHQLAEKHNLPLKSSYNATRGFHIPTSF